MKRALGLILWVMTTTAIQAEPIPEEERAALGAAMAEYFANQLRSEMALDDAQVAAIVPLVQQMERERSQLRRERAAAIRALRQAFRDGADEAELRIKLEAVDAFELRQLERQRELQAEIDSHLGVREQVQFRFFSQRFRRRIQERISEIRDRVGDRIEQRRQRLRRKFGAGGGG